MATKTELQDAPQATTPAVLLSLDAFANLTLARRKQIAESVAAFCVMRTTQSPQTFEAWEADFNAFLKQPLG